MKVPDELVSRSIELPSGELRLLQPKESAELPDAGPVEWAPIAPYWSVLWRSGVTLARELDGAALQGLRVVELGCGLAVPSLAAARAGAAVLATDACAEALTLAARNARANELPIQTARADWAEPGELLEHAPFDLVLAADVLYTRANAEAAIALFPRLVAPGGRLVIADPNRAGAEHFLERFDHRTEGFEGVSIHTVQFHGEGRGQP